MSETDHRVVFDCNIFLQGAANRRSQARRALRLFFDGKITLFVSAPILEELHDVLNRPVIRYKFPKLNDRIVRALLKKIERKAVVIENIPEEFHFERDPKDEPYLNLAIVTNSTYLVSKDNDLLDLMTKTSEDALAFRRRYPFLKIIQAKEFIAEILVK